MPQIIAWILLLIGMVYITIVFIKKSDKMVYNMDARLFPKGVLNKAWGYWYGYTMTLYAAMMAFVWTIKSNGFLPIVLVLVFVAISLYCLAKLNGLKKS
ncbi:hypothetical protein K2V56_00605 [Staphylococcus chromogenes]|uniref:hypothetical protein n=1 Tax=Staphylococcus chromogenes TaxID=46126 RepID=UPI001E3EC48B|nr:hypothetical protein [Staphylococcus chromogenes]MCD8903960.1 hypothetical protein [Staphylococcus chromogenes]UXS68142.1 hypothetical protein MUA19_01550 [Staphylococcus chromogenes]